MDSLNRQSLEPLVRGQPHRALWAARVPPNASRPDPPLKAKRGQVGRERRGHAARIWEAVPRVSARCAAPAKRPAPCRRAACCCCSFRSGCQAGSGFSLSQPAPPHPANEQTASAVKTRSPLDCHPLSQAEPVRCASVSSSSKPGPSPRPLASSPQATRAGPFRPSRPGPGLALAPWPGLAPAVCAAGARASRGKRAEPLRVSPPLLRSPRRVHSPGSAACSRYRPCPESRARVLACSRRALAPVPGAGGCAGPADQPQRALYYRSGRMGNELPICPCFSSSRHRRGGLLSPPAGPWPR